MRNAFADELTKLGDEDHRVVMLSGDIGNRLFDAFKDKHQNRFFKFEPIFATMIYRSRSLRWAPD
jgi:transketolase C-terminal domain/subunit